MPLLLLVIMFVVVFEYAALRWGIDSRDAFRFRRH